MMAFGFTGVYAEIEFFKKNSIGHVAGATPLYPGTFRAIG